LLQNLAYPGDLIFTQRGTLGQVVEIPKTSAHQRFVVSQSQMKLTVNPEKACPRFIFHFFRSPGAVNTLNQRIQATGVPHINLEILKSFPVILPPLPEQRRIAAILDKADAIRRKREEGIRLTEELLRSTFLEMFGDPATNPKRWAMEKLGELASIRRGSSPRPIENYMGGDVPWIKIGDATKGDSFYITETEDYVTKAGAEKSVLLEPGSLVVANSGVSLGFARILKIKGCVHDGWLSLEKLDDRLNKIYLLRLINSLTDHFRAIAPEGTQPNLNTGIMKNFRVAIPPIDLQRKFERSAYGIVELSAARKKAAIEAEALFGSIVQRAFRGELTSKGDE
jgi:type I restriction enzyme S subunit